MRKRTGKHYAFLVILALVAAALTLAAAELALRIFRPVPFSVERNMYFEPDPFTGYRIKPNSRGFFQHGILAQVNEHGHRDESTALQKPDGVLRILAIGDSFTVGANVEQEEAYPEVLETLMNRSCPEKVEVINAGVGGYNPFQYAQYYEHYGRAFTPDVVLVGLFVGNDTYDDHVTVEQLQTAVMGRRVSRRAASQPSIRIKVFLYTHFHIARLMLYRGPVAGDLTREDCRDFTGQYLKIQASRLFNHLKRSPERETDLRHTLDQLLRIKMLTARDGIALGVVLIPDENQVNPDLLSLLLADPDREDYDLNMPQALLIERLHDAGIPVIDLLAAFRNDNRCLYMNDSHWTPEGHALAAHEISAQWNGLCRGLLTPPGQVAGH